MNTRDTLDHQRRMLRHLTAQADTLKSSTAQLKHAVERTPNMPNAMSETICPRCGRRRFLPVLGKCECQSSQ